MESNDSPEIPDRGETSDIPGLPSGVQTGGRDHTSPASLRRIELEVRANKFALIIIIN